MPGLPGGRHFSLTCRRTLRPPKETFGGEKGASGHPLKGSSGDLRQPLPVRTAPSADQDGCPLAEGRCQRAEHSADAPQPSYPVGALAAMTGRSEDACQTPKEMSRTRRVGWVGENRSFPWSPNPPGRRFGGSGPPRATAKAGSNGPSLQQTHGLLLFALRSIHNNRVLSRAPTQPPGTLRTFAFALAGDWIRASLLDQAPALDLQHAPTSTSGKEPEGTAPGLPGLLSSPLDCRRTLREGTSYPTLVGLTRLV